MYIDRIAENKVKKLLKNPKVVILLGARQVGKTTLIEQVLKQHKSVILNIKQPSTSRSGF